MAGRARTLTLENVNRLRHLRRFRNAATLGLVVLGPILALATFLVLGPLDRNSTAFSLRLILLSDFVYVLIVAALVMMRIASMIAARRAKSAGSRLHLRLTGVFALIAFIPAVMVAIFAGLTINVGLEGWFSDRVRGVVGASLEAAEAYQQDEISDLTADGEALAEFLNSARERNFFISDGDLRQLLGQGQSLVQRGLREAYIINGLGEIRSRGEGSYLFDFEAPEENDVGRALLGETVLIQDTTLNEFRAIIRLTSFPDHFLYISREM